MNCEKCTYNVADYVAGALDDAERAEFERALEGCDACRAELAHQQNIVRGIAAERGLSMPGSRREHLMMLAREETGGQEAVVSIDEGRSRRGQLLWLLPAVAVFAAAFAWLLLDSNTEAPVSRTRGAATDQVAVADHAAPEEREESLDRSELAGDEAVAEVSAGMPEYEAESAQAETSADRAAAASPSRPQENSVARAQRRRAMEPLGRSTAPVSPGGVGGSGAGRGGAPSQPTAAAERREAPGDMAEGTVADDALADEENVGEGATGYQGSAVQQEDAAPSAVAELAPSPSPHSVSRTEPSRRAPDAPPAGRPEYDAIPPTIGLLRTLYATGEFRRYLRESSTFVQSTSDDTERAEAHYFRGRILAAGSAAEREYASAVRAAPGSRWGQSAAAALETMSADDADGAAGSGTGEGKMHMNDSAAEPR